MFRLMMHVVVPFRVIPAVMPVPKWRCGYCNQRETLRQGV